MNEAALAYWEATGYTNEDLLSFCRKYDKTQLFGLLHFVHGDLSHITISSCLAECKQGHLGAWSEFLSEMAMQHPQGSSLHGSCILWAHDGLIGEPATNAHQAPLLTFGRHCHNAESLLIPDPSFLHSAGHVQKREEIHRADEDIPWERKLNSAFWRGAASSGGAGKKARFLESSRVRLALLSKEWNSPELLDAKITKAAEGGEVTKEDFEELGLFDELVPFSTFQRYRYQIDIDGVCCAWLSCFLKLASQSAVLKVESHYEQWYFDRLVPWVHFVPVSSNLSNLRERIEWLQNHDESARAIGMASHQLMKEFTLETEQQRTGDLLLRLLACQKDR
ncbi:MAG: hypothetical protein KDD55_02020 [Bdellovibrionales bacterium]|nr:hypothetical protein [Bdellovibrionales bacterium]